MPCTDGLAVVIGAGTGILSLVPDLIWVEKISWLA